MALSSLMRGSLDDRIKWLWNFYDINKDGKITQDEIQSMINSLYDLMGPNTSPNDDFSKHRHIESVLEVSKVDNISTLVFKFKLSKINLKLKNFY